MSKEILRAEQSQKLQEAEKNRFLLESIDNQEVFVDDDLLQSFDKGHLRFGLEIAILGLKKELGLEGKVKEIE